MTKGIDLRPSAAVPDMLSPTDHLTAKDAIEIATQGLEKSITCYLPPYRISHEARLDWRFRPVALYAAIEGAIVRKHGFGSVNMIVAMGWGIGMKDELLTELSKRVGESTEKSLLGDSLDMAESVRPMYYALKTPVVERTRTHLHAWCEEVVNGYRMMAKKVRLYSSVVEVIYIGKAVLESGVDVGNAKSILEEESAGWDYWLKKGIHRLKSGK